MTTSVKERPGKDARADESGVAVVVADRADLLRAAQVASVVETKNTIPILGNMLIEVEGDRLALTATNLDIAVRVVIPARSEGAALETTVAAKRLAGLVGSADEGCQVRLTLDPGARDLVMKAGGGRYKLPQLPRGDFPLMDFTPGPHSFTIPANRLAAVLSRTAFAECDNVAKYWLAGTSLQLVDDKLMAVATETNVLAALDLCGADQPGLADWPPIILPDKLTALIVRLFKEDENEATVTLDAGGKRVRFERGDWSITAKLIDGIFPGWRHIIPADAEDRQAVVDSGALQRAIRRVGEMSGEKTRIIEMALEPDAIVLRCQSVEIGEGEERVAATCPVDGMTLKFNAIHIRDIAAAASGDSIALTFGEHGKAIVRVQPLAAGGFVGVINPLQI